MMCSYLSFMERRTVTDIQIRAAYKLHGLIVSLKSSQLPSGAATPEISYYMALPQRFHMMI